MRNTTTGDEKRNIHLLFALGISGSVFLSLLCIRSHHYTALYYRYFSFCIPFCCLFTAYVTHLCIKNESVSKVIKSGLIIIISVPALSLFLLSLTRGAPKIKYNHIAIANEIISNKITKIEVPEWSDALLIQCVLPDGYKIDYVKNPASTNFTLYNGTTTKQIPVIKNNT